LNIGTHRTNITYVLIFFNSDEFFNVVTCHVKLTNELIRQVTTKNNNSKKLQSKYLSFLSPVHTCHKMAQLNGTILWCHKIAPFLKQ